jgi:hypothetical protein
MTTERVDDHRDDTDPKTTQPSRDVEPTLILGERRPNGRNHLEEVHGNRHS